MRGFWEQYQGVIEPLQPYLPWIFTASVAMSVLGLLAIPVVAISIRSDYFVRPIRPVPTSSQHPALRWTIYIVRNIIAAGMIGVGVLLLMLPGNGLLLILVGLMMGDFKWKHRWLRGLIRRPSLHRPINWLRRRAGRPPIELPHRPMATHARSIPDAA